MPRELVYAIYWSGENPPRIGQLNVLNETFSKLSRTDDEDLEIKLKVVLAGSGAGHNGLREFIQNLKMPKLELVDLELVDIEDSFLSIDESTKGKYEAFSNSMIRLAKDFSSSVPLTALSDLFRAKLIEYLCKNEFPYSDIFISEMDTIVNNNFCLSKQPKVFASHSDFSPSHHWIPSNDRDTAKAVASAMNAICDRIVVDEGGADNFVNFLKALIEHDKRKKVALIPLIIIMTTGQIYPQIKQHLGDELQSDDLQVLHCYSGSWKRGLRSRERINLTTKDMVYHFFYLTQWNQQHYPTGDFRTTRYNWGFKYAYGRAWFWKPEAKVYKELMGMDSGLYSNIKVFFDKFKEHFDEITMSDVARCVIFSNEHLSTKYFKNMEIKEGDKSALQYSATVESITPRGKGLCLLLAKYSGCCKCIRSLGVI